MKNKQEKYATILADVEVFDYLKEKAGERKTKTEAYCDLLDKSQANFISPFLRKTDCELLPNQCHVTVSDLAAEWHWHRATVRSFLDAMETFGLLSRIRFSKSVIITMTIQSGNPTETSNVQDAPDIATQLQDTLSGWIIGKTTSAEVGELCGRLVLQAMNGTANIGSRPCPDNIAGTLSERSGKQDTDIQTVVLGCISHAALQKVLRKSRFDDISPLTDFFRLDLGGEWNAFLEASKEFAGLILDTETDRQAFGLDEDKKLLKSFLKPFLSLASRAQEAVD